jgi:hypothetical protein
MMVIRRESSEIDTSKSWTLVYGRRKTGKTFLLRNYVRHDLYYHVRTDGSISSEGLDRDVLPEDLVASLSDPLGQGRIVIVDEFQRLPERFYDDVSLLHPKGRLILTGSSMKIVNKVMSRNSPLLGMLYPIHLSTIDPVDMLLALSEEVPPEKAIELAPIMQDPWTIPLIEGNYDLEPLVKSLPFIVPGLIGEVFTLEEKELSRTYEAILALMGAGVGDSAEIANILFTRGIIPNPGSNYVFPYIKNMQKMGLIRQDRYWKGKRNRYSLVSAPMELYHYLNSRYDLDARPFTFKEIEPTVDTFVRKAIERFLGDLFANVFEGRVELLKDRDREIDVMITKRNRPFIIAEVKWGQVKDRDLEAFVSKTEEFDCRKLLISKERFDHEGIESWIPEDIISLIHPSEGGGRGK